jgi:hypothetical protein
VVENASVFEAPRTTARVLGTVPPGTQVRWVKTLQPGWEEILLRDGRSVYMQSNTLGLSGGSSERPSGPGGEGEGGSEPGDMAALPAAVDGFLATLQDADLLRASTYLAPGAPPLEESDLGSWSALVGPQVEARVGRIEPLPEGGDNARSVLVVDAGGATQVQTTWRWDPRQERWLLSSWQ